MTKEYYVEFEELVKCRRVFGVSLIAGSEEEAKERVSSYDFVNEPELLDEYDVDTYSVRVMHVEEVEDMPND